MKCGEQIILQWINGCLITFDTSQMNSDTHKHTQAHPQRNTNKNTNKQTPYRYTHTMNESISFKVLFTAAANYCWRKF